MLVEPEGLERDPVAAERAHVEYDDPLLHLFHQAPISPEAFHEELRKQRSVAPQVSPGTAVGAHL